MGYQSCNLIGHKPPRNHLRVDRQLTEASNGDMFGKTVLAQVNSPDNLKYVSWDVRCRPTYWAQDFIFAQYIYEPMWSPHKSQCS
jgi:hypothetical protein